MVLYTEAAAVDANLLGTHGTLVKRDLTHHDLSERVSFPRVEVQTDGKCLDGFPKDVVKGRVASKNLS